MSIKQIANANPLPSPTDAGGDGLGMFREIAESVSLVPEVTKARKRFRFSFWLDALKSDQNDLCYWIADLKLKRTFAPILRTALSLYRELMAGDLTMLYELFPQTQPLPPIITPEKLKEMEKEIDKLRIQVDILIKQQSPAAVDYTVKMASAGEGAPVRTPRPSIAPKPAYVEPSVAQEVDTSEAFLNGF